MAISIGKSLTKSALGSATKSATKGAIAGGLQKAAVNYGKDILTKSATGGASNWVTSLFGGGGSGGGGLGGLFGTSTGAGSTLGGDLFKGLLSGLNSAAGAAADAKDKAEFERVKGLESRKTTAYEAELLDFYKNKDKYRDFRALDNYSQFSRVSQFAPNYKPTYTGPVDPGTAPVPKA